MNGKIELRLFQTLTIINHGDETMLLQEIMQNVYISIVGSTDLKPLDISDAVVKEKLSFLLFLEMKKGGELPASVYCSTFSRPSEEKTRYRTEEVKWGIRHGKYADGKDKEYELILLKPGRLYFRQIDSDPLKYGDVYTVPPFFHAIKSNVSFEEISLFDATRNPKSHSNGNVEYYSDSERIEELLEYFEIADKDMYAKFKVGRAFKPQKFPMRIPRPQKKISDTSESEESTNARIEEFVLFQRELREWFKRGFPRSYERSDMYFVENLLPSNRVCWTEPKRNKSLPIPSPVFYKPLGPMAYDIQPFNKFKTMRLQRFFFNPDGCGLRETLIPTIFIHEKFYQYPVMTGLPNMDQVPLWNVRRIMKKKPDTVVICGCIQDAEALQRANAKNENVMFTGFVGDNLDRVDFSPLNGKNVVFLISNHNGMSMADAYFEVEKVYQYLTKSKRGKKNLIIPEFAFVQRQVEYPDSSKIGTPRDLASKYYHNRPKINPKATFPKIPLMDESDFAAMLAKIRKSPTDSSLFLKKEKRMCKEKTIYPSDYILIRSLLYRGETTLLSGFRGCGKSRFCQTLIRYIVNGKDTEFLKERFWTRCCKRSTIKIVYWNFDGVGKPELEKWKQQCLKGLPTKKRNDIFIENSPRLEKGFHKASGKPILEQYQKRINKYASEGTPDHPVDLLIVDTLSRVWSKDKVTDSLDFLADLALVTNMAILVVHHTDDNGKVRGGVSVEDVPRVSLIIRNLQQKKDLSDDCDPEIEEPEFFQMWYHKNNNVGLSIEKKSFYCVRDNIDTFTVLRPKNCTREEMFDVLNRYYKLKEQLSNKAIGELLGCSESVIQKKELIDKETYENFLDEFKLASPLTPEEEKEIQKAEEKRQKEKWKKNNKLDKIESGDGN